MVTGVPSGSFWDDGETLLVKLVSLNWIRTETAPCKIYIWTIWSPIANNGAA